MGGEFETFGNRERTVVSISAGPKAIEELATDVLVPSINQPLFLKYEMFHPWSQAKAAGSCPVDNAFHQASFTVSKLQLSFERLTITRAVSPITTVSPAATVPRTHLCSKNEMKFLRTWPETSTIATTVLKIWSSSDPEFQRASSRNSSLSSRRTPSPTTPALLQSSTLDR